MTPSNASLAESIALLPASERKKILATLRPAEAERLAHEWRFWARPNQLAPVGPWAVWLLLAGRGFGKTRTGAEWVRDRVKAGAARIALVAETAADARDVMVEGESGLLSVCWEGDRSAAGAPLGRPLYEPSKRRVTWANGAMATTYSAEEPDQLRGPQHDTAWADELAKWRYEEAWDNLMLGLRLGDDPRSVVTTTPKPTRLLRRLIADKRVTMTRGSTFDNRAHLAQSFLDGVVALYGGTRIGRQELMAEMLEDAAGALWRRAEIEALRVKHAPDLKRIVVAIDPAVSAGEGSDETGIIVAGYGLDEKGYVLQDLSGRYSPAEWAGRAIAAFHRWHADRLIGEVNNGGDMIEHTLRAVDRRVAYRAVRASRGKHARAEPIAALYEQGRVRHVGAFPALEDQMVSWEPLGAEHSPDRVDALVWALTELMLGGGGPAVFNIF
jgi:phage terminase large subunit-like protein